MAPDVIKCYKFRLPLDPPSSFFLFLSSSFPCPVREGMVLSDETLNSLSIRHVAREPLTAFKFLRGSDFVFPYQK